MTAAQPHADRLSALRRHLAAQHLDGLLMPRADRHQSEYLSPDEERVAWLTGFTGSAGFVVVLADRAAVFTDGRYAVQVKAQVDARLFEAIGDAERTPLAWLEQHGRPGLRLGYDAERMTPAQLDRYRAVAERRGWTLQATEPDPIALLWTDRPAPPLAPAVPHDEALAGATRAEKLARLRAWLAERDLSAILVSDPPSLAWLFNLRGGDVPHLPMAFAHALVPATGQPTLFMAAAKITPALREALGASVALADPEQLGAAVAEAGKAALHGDRDTAPVALVERARAGGGRVELGDNPILRWKAVKTAAEQDGARRAHLVDGVAMVRFLAWLDGLPSREGLDERTAAARLAAFRARAPEWRDHAFETISASGPNAALPHYRVTAASNRALRDALYLVDSGGQYPFGTTDITRTVALGRPTRLMRDRFTRVLKGMVAISLAVFPKGTSGAQLDSFARAALWSIGADFDHGTGHGVGSYLSVHEGPQRLSKLGTAPLEPGMILSNEPGYYREGAFGIRIENLLLVEPRTIPGAERTMLGFETLTLCPIDRRLIARGLLTAAERRWLDSYHAGVRAALMPALADADDAPVRAWLDHATAPL